MFMISEQFVDLAEFNESKQFRQNNVSGEEGESRRKILRCFLCPCVTAETSPPPRSEGVTRLIR